MASGPEGGAAALRILLVEDNPFHLRLVASMTADAFEGRATVDHAGALEDALAAMADAAYDCVLLDLMLPDAIGLEGLHAIRNAHPEVPVVVVSAHDDTDTAVRCVEEGAQDYLVKGIAEEHQLKLAVLHAIERSGYKVGSDPAVSFRNSPAGGAPSGLAVLDGRGHITSVDQTVCAMLGQGAKALIGRPVPIHADDSDGFLAALHALGEGELPSVGVRVRLAGRGDAHVAADIHLGVAMDADGPAAVMMQIAPLAEATPSTTATAPAEIGWRATG